MEFIVRESDLADRIVWVEMRAALWPEKTREEHARHRRIDLRVRAELAKTAGGKEIFGVTDQTRANSASLGRAASNG